LPAPSGLTARELDVLRLLAEGLSNAQIAGRLAISPRTVDNHLVSLYSKLHVSSRTAAARSAHEQHLL
jgi:DNA-binding NarL/FixJ family response regulator